MALKADWGEKTPMKEGRGKESGRERGRDGEIEREREGERGESRVGRKRSVSRANASVTVKKLRWREGQSECTENADVKTYGSLRPLMRQNASPSEAHYTQLHFSILYFRH